MSNPYKDHPGKGFTPVGGYEPPAGTQASEQRRRDLDTNRQSGGGGYGGGCFPAGTGIGTPIGNRHIHELKSGDHVFSFNTSSGIIETCKVLSIRSYNDNVIWVVHFEDGGELRTTATHSFLIEGSWEKAHNIKAGDFITCFDSNNRKTIRKVVDSVKSSEKEIVYNIIVEKNFNFIADGALAHSFTYFRVLRTALWSLRTIFVPAEVLRAMASV